MNLLIFFYGKCSELLVNQVSNYVLISVAVIFFASSRVIYRGIYPVIKMKISPHLLLLDNIDVCKYIFETFLFGGRGGDLL